MKTLITERIVMYVIVAVLLMLPLVGACGSESPVSPTATPTLTPTTIPTSESPTPTAVTDSTEILLIDTFTNLESNLLDGDSTTFGTVSGWVSPELVVDEQRITVNDQEGYVLQLTYDVTEAEAYAGYITSLNGLKLSDYQTLALWIKGANGDEVILAGLKDGNGIESKVEVGDYLLPGITTTWQKAVIPLTAFSAIEDWQTMQSLSLSFENRIGSERGTANMDDIQFGNKLGSMLIDNFDNQGGNNLLGGEIRIFYEGDCTIDADYDPLNTVDKSTSGYRISYGGSIGEPLTYCGWGSGLQGVNVAGIDSISFFIKGSAGREQPNIYLDDGTNRANVDIENYTLVSNSWQEVNIPLSEFSNQGVDITHLEEFQVVFEWERMSGSIYIDNLAFVSSQD